MTSRHRPRSSRIRDGYEWVFRSARLRRWLAWVFRPTLCFGGLATGLVFFWLSLTPSLLPRSWVAQGLVSGFSIATGYGIGSAVSALYRSRRWAEPSRSAKRVAWWSLGGAAVVVSVLILLWSQGWQSDLLERVGLPPEYVVSRIGIVLVGLVIALIVLVVARVVRSATRFLIRQVGRVAPPRVSVPVGVALAALLIVGLAQGVLWRAFLSSMNSSFSVVDATTDAGVVQPTLATRTGGPGSVVDWDTLGRQGRSFIGRGPTVADLQTFHGADCRCLAPVRVYVGLDSAPTPREQADLAVRELDRTGAFDRSVLAVHTATGTGWINPNASDALDYLYRGDTAQVTMQYSFLPSAISVFADQARSGEATRQLFGAIERRLASIPEADRPTVFVFGESLGSFGVETGFGSIAALQARTDGVLMIGPTYNNPVRDELTRTRQPGSPEWQPVITRYPGVYFAQDPAALPGPPAPGDPARVVYLQNASDPVTWWEPPLAWDKPDWAGSPPAPDRSPQFRWMPLVTFWQVVGDLPVAGEVPGGHGHIFGANIVNGWLALGTPPDWTGDDTARLRHLLDNRDG